MLFIALAILFCFPFRLVVARLALAGALPRLLARALFFSFFFFFSFRLVVARLARAGALLRLLARALAVFLVFFASSRRPAVVQWGRLQRAGAGLGSLFSRLVVRLAASCAGERRCSSIWRGPRVFGFGGGGSCKSLGLPRSFSDASR